LIFDTIDGKLFIVSVLVDAESPPRVNQKGGNTMDHLKQELLEQIEKLTPLQQKQVLDFALEKGGNTMDSSTTIQEIVERLDKLTPWQQKQILNSVLSFLEEPIRGTPGKELLKFVGTISKEDLEIMKTSG
jgi:hypothetical protein